MATVDLTSNQVHQPPHAYVFIVKRRISFAANPTPGSTDTIQVISVPAGTFVHQVMVKVITAEGATCTGTVGDGADVDGYDVSTNLNATAGTVTIGAPGTDQYLSNGGKPYTSADTIDIVLANAAATAVIDVFAVVSFLAPTA